MSDLISRQAAIDAIDDVDWYHLDNRGEMVHGANSSEHQAWYKAEDVYTALDSVPSAQPERKTGKWIKLDMHAHLADHKCTACGQECYVPTCMGEPMYTYCPNCGARMEVEG